MVDTETATPHLWFQQKLIEAISQSVTVHSNGKDGDYSL